MVNDTNVPDSTVVHSNKSNLEQHPGVQASLNTIQKHKFIMTLFTDLDETGLYFMATMLSSFPSNVLQPTPNSLLFTVLSVFFAKVTANSGYLYQAPSEHGQ